MLFLASVHLGKGLLCHPFEDEALHRNSFVCLSFQFCPFLYLDIVNLLFFWHTECIASVLLNTRLVTHLSTLQCFRSTGGVCDVSDQRHLLARMSGARQLPTAGRHHTPTRGHDHRRRLKPHEVRLQYPSLKSYLGLLSEHGKVFCCWQPGFPNLMHWLWFT